MSESHEPSYYEIALTNRQVIVAFVILLVCLIASFFSGVWVGRESGFRSAEQMARTTAPPEEKKEGQNLEELEFFDSSQKAESAPAPAPPDAGPSLAEEVGAEKVGAEDASPADRTASRPAEEPPPIREVPPAETRPAAREEQQAEARPAPDEEKPRKKRDRKESAAPEPARTAGQVVIQVFSSPEKDQADRIRTQLVRGGQRAFLSPVEVAGRTMYRVRIGPFDSRTEAQKVAEQVRKGYKLDTWVTE